MQCIFLLRVPSPTVPLAGVPLDAHSSFSILLCAGASRIPLDLHPSFETHMPPSRGLERLRREIDLDSAPDIVRAALFGSGRIWTRPALPRGNSRRAGCICTKYRMALQQQVSRSLRDAGSGGMRRARARPWHLDAHSPALLPCCGLPGPRHLAGSPVQFKLPAGTDPALTG